MAYVHPMQPIRSQRGRILVLWLSKIGYVGSRPTTATATAFSTSKVTTQTVTSKNS